MSKVTVAEFVSLDGVMGKPQWTIPYWNDEIAKFKYAELLASDGLLLGRKTYEGFAQAWPPRADADDYADRMNSLPKYVVPTTLPQADWQNSTIITGDISATLAGIKARPG
ncbi:MAG: dihydrofolate reductase family protein, partial [Caldilineaceae bacterium]|nr:dihydrofolate reductase family protein [Caldilineaceae bacterium]